MPMLISIFLYNFFWSIAIFKTLICKNRFSIFLSKFPKECATPSCRLLFYHISLIKLDIVSSERPSMTAYKSIKYIIRPAKQTVDYWWAKIYPVGVNEDRL